MSVQITPPLPFCAVLVYRYDGELVPPKTRLDSLAQPQFAPLSHVAEESGLNPLQGEFDSHEEHQFIGW